MRFYSTERLGPKQSLTPEGFLLCESVAIGRTGTQLYSTDDLPLLEGVGGRIHIKREANDVFRPETLASFEGKAVTLDHPDEFVNPESWSYLAKGTVQNVRRGEGIDNDLVIADLLVTDAEAIKRVRNKELLEVSCGYNAEYEQEMPGLGKQHDIVGNHVALVARGRAGPRCSIQDKETTIMATPADKKTLWKKIRAAFVTQDTAALAELAKSEDAEESEEEKKEREEKMKTGDSIAKLQKTVDSLVLVVGKLVTKDADKDDEDDNKTDDSEESEEEKKEREAKEAKDTILEAEKAGKADVGTVYTGDSALLTSRVEILAPGFSMPTADGIKKVDVVAKLQRAVLTECMKTADGRKSVEPFLSGQTVDTLTVDALNAVFVGASELARVRNNVSGARSGISTKDFGAVGTTPAAINMTNKEFWSNRSSK